MALFKQDSARRREVKKNKPKSEQTWQNMLLRQDIQVIVAMVLVIAFVGGWLASLGRSELKYRLHQVVDRPIVSRVEFTIVDQSETEKNRVDAMARISPVFNLNPVFFNALNQRLDELIKVAGNPEIKSKKDLQALEISIPGITDPTILHLKENYYDTQDNKLLSSWGEHKKEYYASVFDVLLILKPSDYKSQVLDTTNNSSSAITFRSLVPSFDQKISQVQIRSNEILSLDGKKERFDTSMKRLRRRLDYSSMPRSVMETLDKILSDVITKNPVEIYLYDDAETMKRKKKVSDVILPVEIPYTVNKILVQSGETIETRELKLLQQEEAEYQAYLAKNTPYKQWYYRFGIFGFFTILAMGLWGYINKYENRIVLNPTRAFAITGLLLCSQATAILGSMVVPQFTLPLAVFPTLMASVIVIVAYNQRFVLVVGAIISVMIALSLHMPLYIAIILMSGVCMTALQVNDVKTRSKLVWTGLWTGIAMAVALFVTASVTRPLHLENQIIQIGYDALLVFVASVFTGLVAQGLLPAIEKVFKVSTAMTLKELNDASHPLLRRLAQEAPGTYQHSLRLADIAESAAIAIDANGLLCKVGAMYHDIGKINKPEYFIENQGGGPNKHNNLSPAMSLLIIVGHVKNGVEMAKEYNLPRALIHFIESHHGTTLVAYFYHAQKKKLEEQGKNMPDEFDFRYPGPKPQTKEAAILMLCDSCESASRALSEPTAVRLEQLVHQIANQRLLDGQYNECNLTLQELHAIEDSVTKTLCAVYHGRIKYPTDKDNDNDKVQEKSEAAIEHNEADKDGEDKKAQVAS